ncbi:hypothetical protein GIY21_01070 [Xanthomonas sontii]|uniref:Uncharacterized protein n=1 Tax=Xanthomonas sontii TaxID=2650745 RepID=A0A6N7Q4N4_9XANT|nr:hypothetical protein [Xanthomonas sontii]MRG98879.1 hypothetical protein [Xanthomonas sontii]MRH73330.1 hypothetical protein [Xanthomonas sontii]
MNREQLQQRLADLESDIPRMLHAAADPRDFWPEFAGAADAIVGAALTGEDAEYVSRRIEQMLARHGLAEDAPSR